MAMDRLKAVMFKRLSTERADWTVSAVAAYAIALLLMVFACLTPARLNLPEGMWLLYFLGLSAIACQFILMALVFNLMGLVQAAPRPKAPRAERECHRDGSKCRPFRRRRLARIHGRSADRAGCRSGACCGDELTENSRAADASKMVGVEVGRGGGVALGDELVAVDVTLADGRARIVQFAQRLAVAGGVLVVGRVASDRRRR